MANFDEWDFAPASSGSAGQSDGFSTAPAAPVSPVKGGWHWQQTFVSLMVVAALSFLIAYLTRNVNNRNTLLIGLSFMVPMAAMLFSALMVENASNAMTPYYSRKAQAIVALLGTLATFTVGCLCDAIYLGNLTPVYETVSVTSNACNFVFAMDKSGSMSGNRDRESIQAINDILDSLPDDVSARMASVCAAAPGVLGVTGLETAEVLRGMAEHVQPDAVIAVDALAARSSSRICSTIQIADTGISPGSGVGNHQKALTRETLGAPVIAVGVPMVVYASTIASDAMSDMIRADGGTEADEEKVAACVERVVSERLGDLIVTPREVDALVERMAGIVAEGINLALHPRLEEQEIAQLMAQ